MAIIDIDPSIIGIRGRQHGLVFSANLCGPYTRGRYKGSNPKTERQCSQRAYLAQSAAAWLNLTGAERTAWNALEAAPPEAVYNSLGQIIVLSGFQWFCKCFARARSVGAADPTNAPTGSAPTPGGDYNPIIYTGAGTQSTISFDPGYFQANSYGVLFFSLAAAGATAGSFRNIRKIWSLLDPGSSPIDIQAEIDAHYAAPLEGLTWKTLAFEQNAENLRDGGYYHIGLVLP